jgi:succinylarginine dihydrolase
MIERRPAARTKIDIAKSINSPKSIWAANIESVSVAANTVE